MTTKSEMLNIRTAVLKMSELVERMEDANAIAIDSEKKMNSILTHLDRQNATINKISIQIIGAGAPFSVDLWGDNKSEAIHTEALISIVTNLLAERTANAIEEVRKLAAKIDSGEDPDEVPF